MSGMDAPVLADPRVLADIAIAARSVAGMVWVAAVWPHRRPVQRALRSEGVFPIGLPGPAALAELTSQVQESRPVIRSTW
jgi:hypothetical protein